MKANFDGAMFDELNEADIGVVVKITQGDVMATLSKKIPKPSLIVMLESLAATRVALLFKNSVSMSLFSRETLKFPSTRYKVEHPHQTPIVLRSLDKTYFVLC